MLNNAVINDARAMSKGQVTIPKNSRTILGITPGDRVTFVAEKDSVRVVNSAVYAMQRFQEEIEDGTWKAVDSEETVHMLSYDKSLGFKPSSQRPLTCRR